MKGRHADSGPNRTHCCSRCGKHGKRSKLREYQKVSGRLFNLCVACAKAIGKKV